MKMELQRRQFLSVLAGIAAANFLAVPARAYGGAGAADAATHISVRRLGEAYLRLRPMEASRESLMASLRHSMQRLGAAQPEGGGVIGSSESIRELIKDDFASCRTINIDGWVLSESECRLCALHVTG